MKKNSLIEHTLYQVFDRAQWAQHRNSAPLTLSETEILRLRSLSDSISASEVADVYVPLSRLLQLLYNAKQQMQAAQAAFFNRGTQHSPFIISIAGSVAVGKSTTARLLQALIQRWPQQPKVDLITTDGFIYPLAELKEKELLTRKGFPESYDTRLLIDFMMALKSGKPDLYVPRYSHITYDRCDDAQHIHQPDILILEGLNVLQTHQELLDKEQMFVSDFVDFSIYVDADEAHLQDWYVKRFLKLRTEAFSQEGSYFKHYAELTDDAAIRIATDIWQRINLTNLTQNILPTRKRANLILTKDAQHGITQIMLRK